MKNKNSSWSNSCWLSCRRLADQCGAIASIFSACLGRLLQLFTSMLVGVATWLAFLWIGVDNAAVWGVTSFALNFIPYVGSIVIIGSASLINWGLFLGVPILLTIKAVCDLIETLTPVGELLGE